MQTKAVWGRETFSQRKQKLPQQFVFCQPKTDLARTWIRRQVSERERENEGKNDTDRQEK